MGIRASTKINDLLTSFDITEYGFIKACVSRNNEKTLVIVDYWNKNNENEILKKMYNEYKSTSIIEYYNKNYKKEELKSLYDQSEKMTIFKIALFYSMKEAVCEILNTQLIEISQYDKFLLEYLCENSMEQHALDVLNKKRNIINQNNFNKILKICCKNSLKKIALILLELKHTHIYHYTPGLDTPYYVLESSFNSFEPTALTYAKNNNLDEIHEIIKNRIDEQEEISDNLTSLHEPRLQTRC